MISHSEQVILAHTFLSDELPANDSLVPRTALRLSTLTQVAPPAWFSFFKALINHFRKFSRNKKPQVGNSHQFTSVLFCFHETRVLDKSFTEISRSQEGGARLGTEQKYFRDLASMTRRRLCISSF